MSVIGLFENAAKEYLREAKDALDNGDCDLCITFLNMARDEILGMVSAQQQQAPDAPLCSVCGLEPVYENNMCWNCLPG
jgi:hypothetical protein